MSSQGDTARTPRDGSALVEIRLFGNLLVRTADGTVVPPSAWRTSKTRDLLRILALRASSPVPTEQIIEWLWPDVAVDKGRASLRTAASRIRRVVGADLVSRQSGGLVLEDVWVDTIAFESFAAEAHRAFQKGDPAGAIRAAREAAALYAGDLAEDEPYSDWALVDRERLRRTLLGTLLEAGDASVELGRLRDAVDLAERVITHDHTNERAYRVLMQAHAGLGETGAALKAFERCREVLAEELGADPSPETQALHVQILNQDLPHAREPEFVGRADELLTIAAAIDRALDEGRSTSLLVTGPSGMGKSRLLAEVATYWPDLVVSTSCTSAGRHEPYGLLERLLGESSGGPGLRAHRLEKLLEAAAAASPVVLVVDDMQWADLSSLEGLGFVLAHLDAPFVLLGGVRSADVWREPDFSRLLHTGQVTDVPLKPLAGDELRMLVADVSGEIPNQATLTEIAQRTNGNPFRAVEAARLLAATGSLQEAEATSGGATLAPDESIEVLLHRAQSTLTAGQQEVFEVAAVLGSFTIDLVDSLLPDVSRDDVVAALDILSDFRFLLVERGAYRFRHDLLADTVYTWLRPSRRRVLHELVAEHAGLPPAAAAMHWAEAGRVERARSAAFEAALEAHEAAAWEEVCRNLDWARELVGEPGPETGAVAWELQGDALARLSRFREAAAAYATAIERAEDDIETRAQLRRKRGEIAIAVGAMQEATRWFTAALDDLPRDAGAEAARVHLGLGAALGSQRPDQAEESLRRAIDLADRRGDEWTAVLARALLAGRALYGQRRFAEADQQADEASALARASDDPSLIGVATMYAYEGSTLLGGALRTFESVKSAWDGATRAGLEELRSELGLLYALALHDLGSPRFEEVWAAVSALAERWSRHRAWRGIAIRILRERANFDEAFAHIRRFETIGDETLASSFAQLCIGRVFAEQSQEHEARALLGAALSRGLESGATMLVPEIAANLGRIEAPHDTAAAAERLDLAEATAGSETYVRERSAVLLGRAAVQAASDELDAAEDLCRVAAGTARSGGHRFLHVEALSAQARYAEMRGDHDTARELWRGVADLYTQVGAPHGSRRVLERIAAGALDA